MASRDGNPNLPMKAPFKCPECQKVSISRGGLFQHVQSLHPDAWNEKYRVRPPRRRPRTNGVATDLKVAGMVAEFFPRGIPTDDPAQLLQDLYFIDDLRTRARSK